MNAPYLTRETIRRYATELFEQYKRARGRPVTFPLDAADLFKRLFELDTIYDDQGVLNGIEPGLIGCLFPDGHMSPWERDKIIAVNVTTTPPPEHQTERIIGLSAWYEITHRNQNFTAAHEGMHYVLHFLKGIGGEQYRRPTYCRTAARKDPLEWQVDFGAGELVTPLDQIVYILDGTKPPTVINVEECWLRYRDYFDANRTMMETRLHVLGYKLINTFNGWADYANEEKQRWNAKVS